MFAVIRNLLASLAAVFLLAGCAVMKVADNLPYGILDNEDPVLVAAALPSYIVTVDGLLVTWPDDVELLRTGASLYSAYATFGEVGPERARHLNARALDYALRAACAEKKPACGLRTAAFADFEAFLSKTRKADLPMLFSLGSAWAGYVQSHSEDWDAVAELARVQSVFQRVVALDPAWERGMPHLYLGVMYSLLPPSLGGKPEVARAHFEQAIALSENRNLYARMMYARQYARLLYDRELHDRLLNGVLEADPHERGLTLINVHAREEARRLLAEADDYF